jgi:hypothetical protein
MSIITKQDWQSMADKTRLFWEKWTFLNKKDVQGVKFKGYSKGYGKRKRANKFDSQASQFKNSTAPVLTQALMNDLQTKSVNDNGYKLGWTSEGAKIKWLADNGRVISNEANLVPPEMDKITHKIVDQSLDKFLGKDETTVINI